MSPFRKASSLGKRKSIRLISVDDIPRWLSIVHFTCIYVYYIECTAITTFPLKKNTLGTAPTLHSDTIKRIRQLTEEKNPSRTVGQTFGFFAPPWGSYCSESERAPFKIGRYSLPSTFPPNVHSNHSQCFFKHIEKFLLLYISFGTPALQ